MNSFEKEALRRTAEAAKRAQEQLKESGWAKEARKRQAAQKLLNRWPEGTTVRDKHTGHEFEYRGNVVENGVTMYLLKVHCYWGYPPIQFSRMPSKEIVRVG